jgi:ribosomal protein L40E
VSKADSLKEFKKTMARTSHICMKCGTQITAGDYYFKEYMKDRFLHSLHAKKLCSKCYETASTSKE